MNKIFEMFPLFLLLAFFSYVTVIIYDEPLRCSTVEQSKPELAVGQVWVYILKNICFEETENPFFDTQFATDLLYYQVKEIKGDYVKTEFAGNTFFLSDLERSEKTSEFTEFKVCIENCGE